MTHKRVFLPLFLLLVCFGAAAYASTNTLLLLYTNDLHDYIKPGADGLGGLPYIAGYIASQRALRDDILLLDGGDVMEKGDMVAHKTQSRIMYEAMGKIGYNAGAVGNHDLKYGIDHLRACAALANMDLLCLNYFDEEGKPHFPASKIYDVQGTRVGVIGLTNLKGGPFLDLEECGRRLADESARLKEDAHLVVVVAHIGSSELAQLSAMAPAVDILVGGHTHELLQTPRVVSGTGALIVSAGHYARYVGYLEVQVDLENKSIADADMKVVAMSHETITPDKEMIAWVEEMEKKYYPEASDVIARAESSISPADMARLSAAALRWRAHVDIGFCHTGQIMRSNLPAGDVDINLLFRTGGQRGRDLVLVELTGAQIEAYIAGLLTQRRGRTEWDGFSGRLQFDRDADAWKVESDLNAEHVYRVIMPQMEWETRFERIARGNPLFEGLELDLPTMDLTFIECLADYVRAGAEQGLTMEQMVARLASTAG